MMYLCTECDNWFDDDYHPAEYDEKLRSFCPDCAENTDPNVRKGGEVMTQCELEETPIGTNCKTHNVIFAIGELQCPYARISELEAENTRLKTLADNYYAIATDRAVERDKLREAVQDAVDDDFYTSAYMIRLAKLVEDTKSA